MEPVTWFLTGMDKHSDEFKPIRVGNAREFFDTMLYAGGENFTMPSLYTAMNELSNHDHSRFLTRTSQKVGRCDTLMSSSADTGIRKHVMRQAVMIQMTWPGAPTVYYGDEAGVCGWTDPDNRRTYPWGHEDPDLLYFHRELIRLHRSYDALKTGSLKFLLGQGGVISYGRFNEDERFVVVINNNDHEVNVDLPVWEIGVTEEEPLVRMMFTGQNEWHPDAVTYHVEHGVLRLHMWPFSGLVLKNRPQGLV